MKKSLIEIYCGSLSVPNKNGLLFVPSTKIIGKT